MVHDNDRERPLPHGNLHNTGNGQPIAWIVDQVARVKLVFILEGGTDMDFPALEIMLAKPFNRVGKDQFFNRWRW